MKPNQSLHVRGHAQVFLKGKNNKKKTLYLGYGPLPVTVVHEG